MKKTIDNKVINIPDAEIETFKTKYNLSEDEAVQLWLEDNDYLENEEVNKLMEKTKGQRHYEKSGKTRKTATKERKVDEEKQAILKKLMEGFSVDSVKNEAEFSFHIGENNYTVKLIKHRPPKTK